MATFAPPPLPPAPPALGPQHDQTLWNAHWSHADLLLRVEQARLLELEREALQGRHAELVAAQNRLAAALEIMPRSRKADLVLDVLARTPQVTGMTDLQQVDLAIARVESWLKRFPGGAE